MAKEKIKPKYDSLVIEGVAYDTFLTEKYKNRKPYKEPDFTLVNAFISGTIDEVFVKVNQEVSKGEPLLILEAMKMKNVIQAPMDSIVKKINVKKADKVIKGLLLIELK
jgi:biotin carboxyl carrier protein